MEFHEIPDELCGYINRLKYLGMKPDERGIYLKYAKRIVRKLESLENSLEKLDIGAKHKRLNYRNVKFVGMRFHGDHVFSEDDRVRLEPDYKERHPQPGTIKVMLQKSKKWITVAYVERGDARWLNTIEGFEKLSLTFANSYDLKALYTIDLRPLEDEGVRIKTKIEVLGKHNVKTYYEHDKLWHNYPDLDYMDMV